MQDLLLVTDPDWAKAKANDPEWLLRSTGETIRSYCGWHIAPNITEVIYNLEIGSNGIIMLPSLYVTGVESVVFHRWPYAAGSTQTPYPLPISQEPYASPYPVPIELSPTKYRWFEEGYIEPATAPYVHSWGYLPNTTGGYATITLSHGYEDVPADIKAVAYELAAWAGSSSGSSGAVVGGDVKTISSPGFSLTLGGSTSLGMNLNPDQKARLNKYKIGGVA